MANDITVDARLDAFFDESAVNLQEDHYVEHGNVSDICNVDHMADPLEIIEQASSIARTAVVQTRTCPLPHIPHKLCLYTWMHTKLHNNEDAICPMCRTTLIAHSPGPWRQSFLEESEALARQTTELLKRLVVLREHNEAFMIEARAVLNGVRAGRHEARLNDQIAMRSVHADNIVHASQRHVHDLAVLIALVTVAAIVTLS